MLINEVESVVGLSKKSIRYYEEEGLLNPKRNINNDYRIYNEDDLHKLKLIKFLRELGVSINDIKRLNNNTLSLEDCLKERLQAIDREKENYLKIQNMCNDIISHHDTYSNIDTNKYVIDMNILNKEGFTMRNLNTNHNKKILEACLSSFIFSLMFIFLAFIITYFEFINPEDAMPILIYIFFMIILLVPIIGIIINLIRRIKEIKGGEEDEASKY